MTFNVGTPRSDLSNSIEFVKLFSPTNNQVICANYDENTKKITKVNDIRFLIIGTFENDFKSNEKIKLKYSMMLIPDGDVEFSNETEISLDDLNKFSFQNNSYKEGKFNYEIVLESSKDKKNNTITKDKFLVKSTTVPIRISTGCENDVLKGNRIKNPKLT